MPDSAPQIASSKIEVIAPNLKRRLSGVTATIARLVPLQATQIGIVATGPGLPDTLPHVSLFRLLFLPRRKLRVWHARRNVEMALGLLLSRVCRLNLALVFTSASQRNHTGFTRWLISKMDEVISTSAKTAAYLERPSRVIHHGIDTEQFCPSADQSALRKKLGLPDGKLIGCFGRIRHQKGTDAFVDAMIALLPDFPDHHGLVLGRATEKHGAFLQELKDRVAKADLEDRIHFLPEVAVDQVASWYQALDLFVAPQRWEGFGLTPLESMACGVPVVATRVGAFEELIVPDKTGTLVAPGDVEALTGAVRSFLDRPDKRQSAGSAARRHVKESFTLQREADRIVAVYRELLNDQVIGLAASRYSAGNLFRWFPFQVDKRTSAKSLANGSSSKADLFAEISGKTVAIVGNARALANGENGAAIDSADVVVRINRAPRSSHISYGQRTDWLALATSLSYAEARKLRPSRVLWFSPKPKRVPYWATRMPGFFFHPKSEWDRLKTMFGSSPSTGAMVIDLVRQTDAKEITLYGFDFFATMSQSGSRDSSQVPHDFDAERDFVTDLIASDPRIKLIPTTTDQ